MQRKPDASRYHYDEGVRQALSAIVQRMDEGETLDEALSEDLDPKSHGDIQPYARRVGFINAFESLQQEVEYAHDNKTWEVTDAKRAE